MASQNFEFVSGRRLDSSLLYLREEKQLYKKKSTYKTKVYYICYRENCNARIIFDLNENCVKSENKKHSDHPDQEDLYQELKSIQSIKRKCKNPSEFVCDSNSGSAIRKIFNAECEKNQESTKKIVYSKIVRTCQRLSSSMYFKSPKTALDVVEAFQTEFIWKTYGVSRDTNSPRCFYKACISEPEFSYCIFASEAIMEGIRENISPAERRYFIDGTFKVVPFGCFKQLLIIYVQYFDDQIFPVFYILTSTKSSDCYTHLLNYIDKSIFQFQPHSFMLDYESALRKSLKTCFPAVILKGCWFHYCQAIRRKISTKFKDVMQLIRSSNTIYSCYHKLLALPLLPATSILDVFQRIENELHTHTQNTDIINFLKYFEKQWLKKLGPDNICVYKEPFRTTSAIEAYNGALGRLIHPNGNFFKFVLALNKDEFGKSRMFNLLTESGGSFGAVKKRKSSRDSNSKILSAIEDLEKGKITIYSYLNRLVFPNNYICTEKEPIEDIFEEPPAYDSDDESSEDGDDLSDSRNVNNGFCVICLDVQANILLLPCRHMKMCNACCLKMKARAIASGDSNMKCPYCREAVCDTMQVFL